jgi:3-oxoacyl-[acyl-carrier-protein] synthase II
MMPAFEHQQTDGARAWDRGLTLLHPFWMLRHLSNNAHAIAAQAAQVQGEGSTFAGANAGAQALAGALRALAAGAVDVAVVVGYDSLIEPETVVELAQRGALSRDPAVARVAPYDSEARGFVPGEAAAAVVLQRVGEVTSPRAYLQAADGADGEHTEACVATLERLAQGLAQLGDVVDGVGLAQVTQDLAERTALARLVGPEVPLGCLSSAMGHLGAAMSVVQAIALTECLQRGMWPPVAGLRRGADGPLRPLIEAEPCSATAALGLVLGAPGLAGLIRVELP